MSVKIKGEYIANPKNEIINDFRVVEERYNAFGMRQVISVNSQGYIKTKGHTSASANEAVIQMVKAFRDGEAKQNKENRLVSSVPLHIVQQIHLETGIDPLRDDETWLAMIVNNPELAAFRADKGNPIKAK